jgi:glycosyltransferase involved in cell wall biosynthesis
MRIAIYENLPLGGAKRSAYELGRQLSQRHELDLYRLSTTSTRAFDLAPHVRHVYTYRYAPLFGLLNNRLAQGRLAPRSLTMFGPVRRLHRQVAADVESRGYDVVLAHPDSLTQSPYLLRWLRKTPGVYYCQEVLRIAYERSLRLEQHNRLRAAPGPLGVLAAAEDAWVLRRWTADDLRNVRAAQQVVVNSRHSRERVWSAYARDAAVCYLGIDADHFVPDAGAGRRGEVLSIGSPLAIKGHDLVIEALARVPDDVRPALLVVAPSARGADALQALALQRRVRLTIETEVDENALIDRYQHAIALVCAARMEPFGLTALEAMACATPVVAVREGGFAETVEDGVTGLLVEPEAGAIADAIARLARDRQFADHLGLKGRARVTQCWTWERSAAQLESILLANLPPPRGGASPHAGGAERAKPAFETCQGGGL